MAEQGAVDSQVAGSTPAAQTMNCNKCAVDLYDGGYTKDGKNYCRKCYKKYIKTGGKKI